MSETLPVEIQAALLSIRKSLGYWESLRDGERSAFPKVYVHESDARAIIAYVDGRLNPTKST